MDDNSVDYYIGRERRERLLGDRATSPAIAQIHFEMADRYRALIRDARMSASLRCAFGFGTGRTGAATSARA